MPLGQLGLGFGSRLGSRPAPQLYNQPMPQEDLESFGSKLRATSSSGLSHVFGVLNKPGRAARGLIAGKPHELLSLLPFSDTAGITKPEDEVTGQDLNKQYLGVKKDDSWGSFIGGLATETALDPLNLATFGAKSALTAAGKTAAKTNALKGLTRAETISKGYGGLAKVGIPFTDIEKVVGTGAMSKAVAGGMDKIGHAARYDNAVGRHLGSAFDYSVKRSLDKITQLGMKKYGTPLEDTLTRRNMQTYYDATKHINELKAAGHSEDSVQRAMIAAIEGHKSVPVMAAKMAKHGAPNLLHIDDELATKVAPFADQYRKWADEMLAAEQEAGLPTSSASDAFSRYFRRESNGPLPGSIDLGNENAVGLKRSTSLLPTRHGSQTGRKDILRDVPGGTVMINQLSVDPRLAGKNRTLAPALAEAEIKKSLWLQATQTGAALPSKELGKQLDKKAAQLSRYLAKVKDDKVASGIPLFKEDVARSVDTRGAQTARTRASAAALYGMVKDNAKPMKALGADAVSLAALKRKFSAMNSSGLRDFQATNTLPFRGATEQFAKAAGIDTSIAHGLQDPAAALDRKLAKLGLPREDAKAILRQYNKWGKAPDEVQKPIKGWDDFTNMFRNLAYPLFPSSHVRNSVGARVANMRTGLSPFSKAYGDMGDLIEQRATAQQLSKYFPQVGSLADQEARDHAWKSLFSSSDIGGGNLWSKDLVGGTAKVGPTPSGVTPATPGSNMAGPTGNVLLDQAALWGKGVVDTAAGLGKRLADPSAPPAFRQQGVSHLPILDNLVGNAKGLLKGEKPRLRGEITQGTEDFPLLAAGRQTGTRVETKARGAQALDLFGKGYAPDAVGDEVWKTHYNYSRLTPFEKNVMKRVFPFYTFMSRNLPLQIETAATNPKMIMNQLRPFMNRDPSKYVPGYLASGVSVPIGQETDGRQQYLSQVGLPIEEAFERFKTGGGIQDSVINTVKSFLGASNPLIKGPLEQLSGEQFFSGRKLRDLKPSQAQKSLLGGVLDDDANQALSQLVSNTPLTRFVSTLDRIADPRKSAVQKAANLMTGIRISDVNLQAAKAAETREALNKILARSPNITPHVNYYVRPEDQAGLSPADIENLQALRAMQAQAQQSARSKRGDWSARGGLGLSGRGL
jgi:hypothetical protein